MQLCKWKIKIKLISTALNNAEIKSNVCEIHYILLQQFKLIVCRGYNMVKPFEFYLNLL